MSRVWDDEDINHCIEDLNAMHKICCWVAGQMGEEMPGTHTLEMAVDALTEMKSGNREIDPVELEEFRKWRMTHGADT